MRGGHSAAERCTLVASHRPRRLQAKRAEDRGGRPCAPSSVESERVSYGMVFVSLTRLRLRSIRFVPLFAIHAMRTQKQVQRAPGFKVGALLPDRNWTFWTMTAWDSQASMRAYMTDGAHKQAMPKLMEWCDEASVATGNNPERSCRTGRRRTGGCARRDASARCVTQVRSMPICGIGSQGQRWAGRSGQKRKPGRGEPGVYGVTRVPRGSPPTTRVMLPSSRMEKTIMGMALSRQSETALVSMTRRLRARISL